MQSINCETYKPWIAYVSSNASKRQLAKEHFQQSGLEIITAPAFSEEFLPCAFNQSKQDTQYGLVVIVDLDDCSSLESRKYCEDYQGVSGDGCKKFAQFKRQTQNEKVIFIGAIEDDLDRHVSPCDFSGFETIVEWPLNQYELKRIKQLIRMLHFHHAHNNELEEKTKIHQAHQLLSKKYHFETAIDSLTDLCSPRSILNKIRVEEARFQRHRRHFCLLMGDIDGLNLTIGNLASKFNLTDDEIAESVLKQVAEILRDGLRAGDTISRWEEDTYLMLLPDTDLEGGQLVTGRLQKLLQQTKFCIGGKCHTQISLTFSLVEYTGTTGLYPLIDLLKIMLAEGKEQGGNRLQTYVVKEEMTD